MVEQSWATKKKREGPFTACFFCSLASCRSQCVWSLPRVVSVSWISRILPTDFCWAWKRCVGEVVRDPEQWSSRLCCSVFASTSFLSSSSSSSSSSSFSSSFSPSSSSSSWSSTATTTTTTTTTQNLQASGVFPNCQVQLRSANS